MKPCFCVTIVLGLLGACAADAVAQATPDIRPKMDFRGHREAVRQLVFHPDGKQLISAGQEGCLRLWSLETGRMLRRIEPRGRAVADRVTPVPIRRRIESIAFSPDGKTVAEVAVEPSGTTTLRLWNPEDGEVVRMLAEGVDNMRALAFTPDGKLIATNMRDPLGWGQKILLRDVQTGKVVAELRDQRVAASLIKVSRDGKLLASAGATKIHIWDVVERKLLHTIAAHKKAIQAIDFSPNGELLVSGSTDDTIRIWKTETGKMDQEIEAEQDGVLAVGFSPNGKVIASGGKDKTVKLWRPKSGKTYARLWGHLDKVYCLTFSPDGKTLATGSADTTIAIWPVPEPGDDEEDEKEAEDEWEED